MSVWGLPKKGKTHFALTFPKPMVAIEVGETGVEDLLGKPEFRGLDIEYAPIRLHGMSPTLADHQQLVRAFENKVREVIKGTAKTLVVDSFSRVLRSVRVVKLDEAQQESKRTKKNQSDFELMNDWCEQLLTGDEGVRSRSDLNVVLVHRHREIFAMVPTENGQPQLQATGNYDARDYSGTENLVQIMVRCDDGMVFDPKTKQQVSAFLHKIELCRFDRALQGVSVANMDYQKLCEKIWGKPVGGDTA